MAGRPVLPAHILKNQGTYRPCRHDERQHPLVETNVDFPPMPADLEDWPRAQSIWEFVESIMRGQEVYTEADAMSLAAYCRLEAMFQEDMSQLEPSQMSMLSKLRTELYLTPASRAKVGRAEPRKKENPFNSL